jgi:hypothetical protein
MDGSDSNNTEVNDSAIHEIHAFIVIVFLRGKLVWVTVGSHRCLRGTCVCVARNAARRIDCQLPCSAQGFRCWHPGVFGHRPHPRLPPSPGEGMGRWGIHLLKFGVDRRSGKTIFASMNLVAHFFLMAHGQDGDALIIEAIPGHIAAVTKID